MSVEIIIQQQNDDADPDSWDTLLAVQNTDLEWVTQTKTYDTTGYADFEAYLAANEATIEADILANGSVNDTLTSQRRLDNMHIRWLDGDTLVSGLSGSTSGMNIEPNILNLTADGIRVNMPLATDGKTLRARQNGTTVLTIDADGTLSAETIKAFDTDGLKIQEDGGSYGVFVQNSTGYVGVGHASPAATLHVAGTSGSADGSLINMPSASTGEAIKVQDNGTNVFIVEPDGTVQAKVVKAFDANGLKLQDDAGNYGIFIDDGGRNIGMGTDSPTGVTGGQLLHIYGATYAAEFVAEHGTGSTIKFLAGASNGRMGMESNHDLKIDTNNTERIRVSADGSVGIGTSDFGSGVGVLGVADAGTNPSTNPSGGGVLYSDSGAGKWRGSSGTVTTFGTAEPHCPNCGADYMQEWDNAETGYFAICLKCLADELGNRPWIVRGESKLEN